MAEAITIAANAVRARLFGADRQAKLVVSELLSYLVEGAEHSDRFKTGSWDGKSSFFDFGDATFPAGFVSNVSTALQQLGYQVLLRRKKLPGALGPDLATAYASISPFETDPRYDYQPETVRRLEKYGMMIARVATGGGKSLISRTAVRRIMRPTLFLTTRQILMAQMKEGFEEAQFQVGVLGDGEWRPKRGVNVAMLQTIASRLGNPKTENSTRKLLSLFELAILEEAHEAGGQTYFDVMNALPNAYYRLALTATPFMRDGAEANMRLLAVSGQIGIDISEKLLIDRGILARPVFKIAEVPTWDGLKKHSGWQRAYKTGIVEHALRNRMIVAEVARAARYGLSSMVLIQRTEHGKILDELLAAGGIRSEFIWGKHEADDRKDALNRLKSGATQCLIGSTILDVGVDVPAVGLVVLAGGGKAEVALRQRIGRGLRAKKTGPNTCMILDFEDGGNTYLRDHARTRRAIIAATPGFGEEILPKGKDFPYEALGFSRAA